VQYGRLVEIGRKHIETRVARPLGQRLMRRALANFLPNSTLFTPALKVGQRLRPLLPRKLRDKVPVRQRAGVWPKREHARKMLLLAGCVQPAMMPNVNTATARVFDALGVQLVVAPQAGCCGAIRLHLGYNDEALDDVRRNIDAWWPYVEQGVEAIVMNASGCGATVKEYGHLLRGDPAYADKARRIAELCRDTAELLAPFEGELSALTKRGTIRVAAFHPPCTLQHGQQISGMVERLLATLGIEVRLPADSHQCCGSAGTYSVLQSGLAYRLRDRKLHTLAALEPQVIISANVGCIAHLQSGTPTPVAHWIELVEHMLSV
jgi:glycolate oxidase iron-sulfur subunit